MAKCHLETSASAARTFFGAPNFGRLAGRWDADQVKVEAVDPRDTTWEDYHPVFRVYFWREVHGWSSDEYEVTNADVAEVLDWAWSQLPAKGTEFAVYLRRWEAHEPGLVLLVGRDPSDPSQTQPFPAAR
jgi:hypothetical protein